MRVVASAAARAFAKAARRTARYVPLVLEEKKLLESIRNGVSCAVHSSTDKSILNVLHRQAVHQLQHQLVSPLELDEQHGTKATLPPIHNMFLVAPTNVSCVSLNNTPPHTHIHTLARCTLSLPTL